jgi:hypothetical protein
MAYHYILNANTGEQRRIRSESLPTYQGVGAWQIFDSEEERAAHTPPVWYLLNYAARRAPNNCTPEVARAYWTRSHLRAGWAVFSDLVEARTMFDAIRPLYTVNVETGETRVVQTWLPEADRDPMPEGFTGAYASDREARATAPKFFCLHVEGYEETCFRSEIRRFEQDGYIVGATRQEVLAQLPIRWTLDGQTYRRVTNGSVMRRPSRFRILRTALANLRRGEEHFIIAARGTCRGGNYQVSEVISSTFNNVLQRHNPDRYDYSTTYNQRAAREFMARFNAMAGQLACGLCQDCEGAAITLPASLEIGGVRVCANCQSNYSRCSDCNCLMHESDARENSHGAIVCRTHWRAVENEPLGSMRSYSTDVTRLKEGFLTAKGERADAKKTLWLGWELECHAKGAEDGSGRGEWTFDEDCDHCGGDGEARDEDGDTTGERCECAERSGNISDAVRKVQEAAARWCIVKEDGSLNNGMEIVSVPASLRWHRENVAPFLERAKDWLSGWPHNDCGIHVHVGKKQLSELQLSRLVRFMHADENQAFITQVAGRDPNTYCNRGGRKTVGAFKAESRIGRYQAINFATRNEKTIEFRIFRSNVSPAGFMKNLEFTHALCQWARFTSDRALGSAAFVQWVARERSQYPCLVRFFEHSAILPKPRRHPDAPVPAFYIAA